MAGTGETPDASHVFVVTKIGGGGFHVFATFEDIVKYYRLLELGLGYDEESMEKEKKAVESGNISMISLGEEIIQIFRADSHLSPRGGRRSRRTFRRNNTLHRNIRRHHVK